VRLRGERPGDFPLVREVIRSALPKLPRRAEELEPLVEGTGGERADVRLVAEDAERGIVGWGRLRGAPRAGRPDVFGLDVCVHPAARTHGIGGGLYRALEAAAVARGARELRAMAVEAQPGGVSFLVTRGFAERQRRWRLVLDVGAFDAARFAGAAARVRAQGITLTTLAAERARDPEAVARAYALRAACWGDVPDADPMPAVDIAAYRRQAVDGPGALPEAYFLAADGGRYVGESSLEWRPERPVPLHQFFTGVLPAYRGRGIALALKLQAVRYAREHGQAALTTGVHARNAPMRRLNAALGFRPLVGVIEFAKTLARRGGTAG
jgi:GNAT superfamily N-acetyltransferase